MLMKKHTQTHINNNKNNKKKIQINFQFDLGFHGKRRKTIPVEAYANVLTLPGTKDTLHDITDFAVPCASDVHEIIHLNSLECTMRHIPTMDTIKFVTRLLWRSLFCFWCLMCCCLYLDCLKWNRSIALFYLGLFSIIFFNKKSNNCVTEVESKRLMRQKWNCEWRMTIKGTKQYWPKLVNNAIMHQVISFLGKFLLRILYIQCSILILLWQKTTHKVNTRIK